MKNRKADWAEFRRTLVEPKSRSPGNPVGGLEPRAACGCCAGPSPRAKRAGGGCVLLGCGNTLPRGTWVCKSCCWSRGAPRLCPVASPGRRVTGPCVKPGRWYFHLSVAMGQLSSNGNFALWSPDVLEMPAWKGSGAGQS